MPNQSSIDTINNSFVRILFKENIQQYGLFALKDFNEGDEICLFSAKDHFTQPNYLTIQVSVQHHISLLPECLQYTNHSCDPNVFFNTDSMRLIAIKKIHIQDELCFFYPSTELSMAQPFECKCGTNECLQEIKGAMFLSNTVLGKYTINSFVTKAILNQHT